MPCTDVLVEFTIHPDSSRLLLENKSKAVGYIDKQNRMSVKDKSVLPCRRHAEIMNIPRFVSGRCDSTPLLAFPYPQCVS